MSRNDEASLPIRNATSGSISSDEASEFAFFAMRCDSTASWFAKSTSRSDPPDAPICCAASCASSSSSALPWLIVSSPFASEVRLCWLPSRRSAAPSTRSQRWRMRSSVLTTSGSCATSSVTPRTVPPVSSASRFALKRSRLSATAGKPAAWPCAASADPRASRCESICISVAVDAEAPDCADCRPSRNTISAANTRNIASSVPSTWNCLTTGIDPMSGSLTGMRADCVAERSCSMMDTLASGS